MGKLLTLNYNNGCASRMSLLILSMNKKGIIIGIIVVVIIVVLAIVFGGSKSTLAPEEQENIQADSPEQITQDLEGLQVDDISKEFQDVDSQIKGL